MALSDRVGRRDRRAPAGEAAAGAPPRPSGSLPVTSAGPPGPGSRHTPVGSVAARLGSRLRPVDFVSAGYLALTAVLILGLSPRLGLWPLLLAAHVAGIVAVGAVAWFCEGRPSNAALILRIWYPALLIPVCYREVPLLVPALWGDRDFDLEAVTYDLALVGDYPTVWMERLYDPLLADVLQVVYFSFLVLPLLLGVYLWLAYFGRGSAAGGPESAVAGRSFPGLPLVDPDSWNLGPRFKGVGTPRDRAVRVLHFYSFLITFGFLSSYLGYLAVPIRGPHTLLDGHYSFELDGTWILREVRHLIVVLEGAHWDCFPSGHTALMLLMIWSAWLFSRAAFVVLVPWGGALIFATVYLRYHYVVDVIAGAILAAVVMLVAAPLFRKLWPEA